MVAASKGSGRLSKLSGAGCLVMFGLFWSALTLVADVALGWGAFRQLHALSHSTTTGRVTQSEIKKVEGDDGPTYRPDIKYTYAVAGRGYTGDRYRYGEWSAGRSRADGSVSGLGSKPPDRTLGQATPRTEPFSRPASCLPGILRLKQQAGKLCGLWPATIISGPDHPCTGPTI